MILTSCTMRKRACSGAIYANKSVYYGSLKGLAKAWRKQLKSARIRIPAGELYVGRAMAEAKRAARTVDGDLYVVSAGLGLIHESELAPNYDFTVSAGSNPLSTVLARTGKPPSSWWTALNSEMGEPAPVARLLGQVEQRPILLALPSSYLAMIADDLNSIGHHLHHRLYVFSSQAGCAALPIHLRKTVLPYDERLESVRQYDGTRADFPQRALRHFVEALKGHQMPREDAQAAVVSALAGLGKRQVPTRARQSDDQIRDLLRLNWDAYNGSSTRLHRYLRDEALVACEQSRFRNLWRPLRDEFQARKANASQ